MSLEEGSAVKDPPRCKFGMDVFLSCHKGFHGLVKTRPEDFRVTEINVTGKLVQLEGAEEQMVAPSDDILITPQLHVDAGSVEVQTEYRSKVGISDLRCVNPANTSISTGAGDQLFYDDLTELDKLRPILNSIIGAELVDGLQTYSNQELIRNDVASSDSASAAGSSSISSSLKIQNASSEDDNSSEMESQFDLGELNEKDNRATVHKAVQCLYPHLKTAAFRLDGALSVHVSTNPTYWDFRKLLTSQQTQRLLRFAGSKFSTRTVSLGTEGADSKEKRTAIHRLVSKHFGKFLVTKTVLAENSKLQEVTVRFRDRYISKEGRGVKRKAVTEESNSSGSVYTGFTLKKENLETLDTLQQLARTLRVQPSDFSYAGVKDKKAITLQSVAVKGISHERFKQIFQDVNLPGVAIGNVHPRTTPIRTGDLEGNSFELLIRDVCFNEDLHRKDTEERALLCQEIDSCFNSVKERGFVNYFGEQRFGQSCDSDSHSAAIGLSMLAGQYEAAVRHILAPGDAKNDPVNAAKRHFQTTQNPKEALALMPNYKSRECLVLKALHRHGLERDGCVRALFSIPHAMRQFYIHAFCSLVWNTMASRRLQSYGYKVVAGDLVLIGDEKQDIRDKILEVTEADVQAETYSIRDVVLPLPGNSIQYPGNRVGAAYKEYMEEAGLGLCTYRVTELQLNIPGNYRRLIQWPKDLEWDLELLCDGDVLSHEEKTDQVDSNPKHQETGQIFKSNRGGPTMLTAPNDSQDPLEPDAKKCHTISPKDKNFQERTGNDTPREWFNDEHALRQASAKVANLRVKFTLPPSTYATVFLRELMKT